MTVQWLLGADSGVPPAMLWYQYLIAVGKCTFFSFPLVQSGQLERRHRATLREVWDRYTRPSEDMTKQQFMELLLGQMPLESPGLSVVLYS